MKVRPILFSTPMVQALLENRKTQTRRIVKTQPSIISGGFPMHPGVTDKTGCTYSPILCPYGKPGDLLYVRETFAHKSHFVRTFYKADNDIKLVGNWIPSLHMPRWASRLTQEIINIKVERLQDISEEDAVQEGIYMCDSGYFWWDSNTQKSCYRSAVSAYQGLWELINGKESWDANPWVWVIEFKVHKCNIDDFLTNRST